MAQTAEKNFGTVHTYREHCIYESIPQAAAKPETASSRLEGRGLWHIHYSDSIFREHFHHMHYASIDVMTECIPDLTEGLQGQPRSQGLSSYQVKSVK